jgi:hypothetical protein
VRQKYWPQGVLKIQRKKGLFDISNLALTKNVIIGGIFNNGTKEGVGPDANYRWYQVEIILEVLFFFVILFTPSMLTLNLR